MPRGTPVEPLQLPQSPGPSSHGHTYSPGPFTAGPGLVGAATPGPHHFARGAQHPWTAAGVPTAHGHYVDVAASVAGSPGGSPGFYLRPLLPASAVPDTGADEYTGYRLIYQLDRFTASYRTLVVFYLAMFIACYAQVVNTYVFWGTWSALVLMYWEPYLAPPYPWTYHYAGRQECFSRVEAWGRRPSWLKPADAAERSSLRQWLFAVRRGLNQKQLQAYKFLVGLIIAPCGLLWTGAVTHIFYQPLEDIRALFSCCILLFLLSSYTLATTASLVLHDWLVAPRLRHVDEGEVAWRTHDMMFFTCKILGETLNVTVQALVAGAFVSYMPTTIFWLSILITALSYTATNLLFGMEQGDSSAHSSSGDSSGWGSSAAPSCLGAAAAYPSTFGNIILRPGLVAAAADLKAGCFGPASEPASSPGLDPQPHLGAAAGSALRAVHQLSQLAPQPHCGSRLLPPFVKPHGANLVPQTQAVCEAACDPITVGANGQFGKLVGFHAWQSEEGANGAQQQAQDLSPVVQLPGAQLPQQPRQHWQQDAASSPWLELPSPGALPPTPQPRSLQLLQDKRLLQTQQPEEQGTAHAMQQARVHVVAFAASESGGSLPLSASSSEAGEAQLLQGASRPMPAAPAPAAAAWCTPHSQCLPPDPTACNLPRATLPLPPAAATAAARGSAAAVGPKRRKLFQDHGGLLRRKQKPQGPPTPPFLTYTAPRGWRDWCIVGLLIAVAAPSAAILFLVSWGMHEGTTELYFEDPTGSCVGACRERYVEILVLLCTLGLLICYYAITVGFLQAGPVTWAYRRMAAASRVGAELLSGAGARIRTTLAGGRVG